MNSMLQGKSSRGCDKAVIKSRAITRLNRKGNPSNSKATRCLVAEEEGFEPPRPFRV